jgi:hypothetical protein
LAPPYARQRHSVWASHLRCGPDYVTAAFPTDRLLAAKPEILGIFEPLQWYNAVIRVEVPMLNELQTQ